jgi:hypothetical protein
MHDLDPASLQVLRALVGTSGCAFLGAGDFNQHIEAQAWSVFRDKLHQLDDFLPQATATLALGLLVLLLWVRQRTESVYGWFGGFLVVSAAWALPSSAPAARAMRQASSG